MRSPTSSTAPSPKASAASGEEVTSALAFSIGFIALLLAKSELFTENFLVPVAALVAGRSTVTRLFRLWFGALVMNLVGGWVMTGIAIAAFPGFKRTAVTLALRYVRLGIGWQSFTGALFGGAVITLMTWMEHSSESAVAQLTAAVSAG